jgi:hypothetical protein
MTWQLLPVLLGLYTVSTCLYDLTGASETG